MRPKLLSVYNAVLTEVKRDNQNQIRTTSMITFPITRGDSDVHTCPFAAEI
jgi:hypothetical protein